MLPYVFVTIPIEKTEKPGANAHEETNVSPAAISELKKLREAFISKSEALRSSFSRSGKSIDALLATDELRTKCVAELSNPADDYASKLISIVKETPSFGNLNYYRWTSTFIDSPDVSYDDYRYELYNVYYNVGAALLNICHYIMCVRATVGSAAALERETYRLLLCTAGYFHLASTLSDAIKANPISVALVSLPFDNMTLSCSLFEAIALAQAQEIGAKRAISADEKSTSDVGARLFHQTSLLYQNARMLSQKFISRMETYNELSKVVMIKNDVFRVLSYSYAASWMLQKDASKGLWLLEKAKEQGTVIQEYLTMLEKHKIKTKTNLTPFVQSANDILRRNCDRILRINSLVHRSKCATEPVPLPEAVQLAIRAEKTLPIDLPVSTPST